MSSYHTVAVSQTAQVLKGASGTGANVTLIIVGDFS